MKALEWFIARRYLASRRKGRLLSLITWIAIGCITLGVTALITVISVMTGLQRDLQSKIIGTNPHIYIFQSGAGGFRLGNWEMVRDSIKDIPNIEVIQPFVMTSVGVGLNQSAATGILYGIQIDSSQKQLNDITQKIYSGELKLVGRSGKPGVVIGKRMADALSAARGDLVKVISIESIKQTGPMGEFMPTIVEFEITDVFETHMYEYDSQFMYAEIKPVQELVRLEPSMVGGIAVNVTDPWNVEAVRSAIDGKLGFAYYTNDWKMLNGPLFGALKLEKLGMGVILFLIILVAAFNIVSTLIMVVADKTREIGILKSMGMTDQRVLKVFVLQGLTIGLIGTTLGVLGGGFLVFLLARYEIIKLPGEVYFTDTLPVALDPVDLTLIVVLSVLISFAATIYPARQAARLLPVEAIRHD
jgi:lipoprotein-releasing system permease protein